MKRFYITVEEPTVAKHGSPTSAHSSREQILCHTWCPLIFLRSHAKQSPFKLAQLSRKLIKLTKLLWVKFESLPKNVMVNWFTTKMPNFVTDSLVGLLQP